MAHSVERELALVTSHLGAPVAFPRAAHFQVVVSQYEQRKEEEQVLVGVAPGVELGLVVAVV